MSLAEKLSEHPRSPNSFEVIAAGEGCGYWKQHLSSWKATNPPSLKMTDEGCGVQRAVCVDSSVATVSDSIDDGNPIERGSMMGEFVSFMDELVRTFQFVAYMYCTDKSTRDNLSTI